MSILADTMTFGLWFGSAVFVLCLLAGLVVMAGVFFDDLSPGFWLLGGVGIVLVSTAVYVFAMWPFKHEYHHWIDKGGVVTDISKRLVPAGDSGMQEKFVFTINGQPYGVSDTRAALVKRGDKVNIRCKKAFEWGTPYEAHGWDCKWAGGVE